MFRGAFFVKHWAKPVLLLNLDEGSPLPKEV